MEQDTGPESQAIPFLDDVFFKPDIEDAGYLGVNQNLQEEILGIRQALKQMSRSGVTVQASNDIVKKISDLVHFSERQSQDIREQILVALLGYFTYSIKASNKDPDIIQAILKQLVGWGIHNFYKDEEYFFVYSVVESIVSNFSLLFPTHKEFLTQYEGLFVQLARNEDDAKVRVKARDLLKLLGLKDRAQETFLDKETVVSNLKKVSDLQLAKQMAAERASAPTHQKELTRKEDEDAYQLKVDTSEPKFKQAKAYIFDYLAFFKEAYTPLIEESEAMAMSLAIVLVQTALITQLFRQLEPPSVALVTDKYGLISEQTSVLMFAHVVDVDPIHRVKSFIDKFQALIDNGAESIFAILPDANVWLSTAYAVDAVKGNEANIKIIDTKTFDFGIGVVFQEAAKLVIKNFPVESILKRIEFTISRLKYWVYLESDELIRDKAWYEKLMAPTKLKALPQKKGGVFAFHNRSRLIDLADNPDIGIKIMEHRMATMVSKLNYKLAVIFVKHNGYSKQAANLVYRLKKRYPDVMIQIVHESELTGSNFGKHIGICIL